MYVSYDTLYDIYVTTVKKISLSKDCNDNKLNAYTSYHNI